MRWITYQGILGKYLTSYGGIAMGIQQVRIRNSQDLDSKSLFSPLEAFTRIKKLIERAMIPNVVGEIQKEEMVPAINAILLNTELFGQILPFGWEKMDLDSLSQAVSAAEILYTKPFYIV